MYDTWKFRRISCRFQICSQKYQFPHSKKVDFFALCKFMQIRWLCRRYDFQGCGTTWRPSLPNMHLIALIVHFSWEIASSSCTVVFGFTILTQEVSYSFWILLHVFYVFHYFQFFCFSMFKSPLTTQYFKQPKISQLRSRKMNNLSEFKVHSLFQ